MLNNYKKFYFSSYNFCFQMCLSYLFVFDLFAMHMTDDISAEGVLQYGQTCLESYI